MNTDKIVLRDRIRAHEAALVARLIKIALFSESDPASVSALNTLLDRGYGKPPQEITGDGSLISIKIVTQVPFPDDEPLAISGSVADEK